MVEYFYITVSQHDSGRTFLVIFNSLAQFGYTVYYKVMSATEYGNLPQTRNRIYIVAVRDDLQHFYCHPLQALYE